VTSPGVSSVPREAQPHQGHEAGLISRFSGSLIDGALVTLVVLVGYLSANVAVFMLDPRSFRVLDISFAFLLGAGIVVAVLYLATGWALTGRSYGCHVMGLRVVDRRRRRPRPLLALLRAGFCVLVPVGLFWCAISRGRSSLQDVVLRTSVVYDWERRPPEAATAASSFGTSDLSSPGRLDGP
jgi:uncharacterized RDD family membrane protein YckC